MWCLLGTAVMVVWLMAPVAKCSFAAFRDTPLSEAQPTLTPDQTDANRVEQSDDFFSRVTTATKGCYARTPLLVGNPKFEISVRGWIGFVEFTTIDWCVNPRLSRVELRDLLTEILFEVLRVVAPPVFRTQ